MLIRVLTILALVGCGAQVQTPETDVPKIVTPTVQASLCSIVQDALYCADGGVPKGEVGYLADSAAMGLYARFTPDPDTAFQEFRRLIEVGGEGSTGGGMALTTSGVGDTYAVNCWWWNADGTNYRVEGFYPVYGEQFSAYCEVSENHIKIYVNGELKRNTPMSNYGAGWKYHHTDGRTAVGMGAYRSDVDFNGQVDTAIVFDRELSDDEIALLP